MPYARTLLLALTCAICTLLATMSNASAQTRIIQPDILLDAADSTTGWRGANPITVDNRIKIHGTASLTSTGSGRERFRKTFSPHDISKMRFLTFWYYIDRPDLIIAANGDAGQIEISSSGTIDNEEMNWSVAGLHLQRGWNYVVLDIPGKLRTQSGGVPVDLTRINHVRVYHVPTGSVTTRIDHIRFTDREPQSSPFAAYLELKRISRSTAAVEQEEALFSFVQRTRAGSAERAKVCRRLRIDLTQREINGFTLAGLGVTQAAVDADVNEKRLIKELICGERTMARTELLTRLQQRAATDIAVTGELASLLDLTMESASETRQTLFDVDMDRIMATCGSNPAAVDTFIDTGTLPVPRMAGVNVLVQDCSGSSSTIATRLGDLANPISNKGAAFRRCMGDFDSMGAQCSNPYANPDDNYDRRIDRTNYTDPQKQDLKEQMRESIAEIDAITLPEARDMTGETHPRPNAPADQKPNLEDLHGKFDLERGKADQADARHQQAVNQANNPPVNDQPSPFEMTAWDMWRAAASAAAQRFRDERGEHLGRMLDHLHDICVADPLDPQCNLSDDEWIPPAPEIVVEVEKGKRCADLDFGDDYKVWFDRARTGNPPAGQLNEDDRIDHCLCELFDRSYSTAVPGTSINAIGNCPTPEERTAQKCLENPYDGVDGVRPECRHLMQPISMDKEAIGAKMCQKILPNCDAPYQKEDGDCGCGFQIPNGGGTKIPECPTGIPNCPNGVPSADGCGCQPFDSGAGACTPGGKDFYLTKNPFLDLKVRTFPNRPTFATENILVPNDGAVRFVTPAFKRNQLSNQSQLSLRAVLPGTIYDGTGQIRVSCTNTSVGTRNMLVETIPFSTLSTAGPTTVSINLNAAERNACYGNNANSNVYLEFFVDGKPNQPVGFYDILGDIGNIKPPCIDAPPRPGPGPRPMNNWPNSWTFSDGTTMVPLFNGTGPIPPPEPAPTLPPLCPRDGVLVPCP